MSTIGCKEKIIKGEVERIKTLFPVLKNVTLGFNNRNSSLGVFKYNRHIIAKQFSELFCQDVVATCATEHDEPITQITGDIAHNNPDFKFDSSCYCTIQISRKYLKVNDAEKMFDTVRHEMAHALMAVRRMNGGDFGKMKSHSTEWKCCAVELKATPRACNEGEVLIPPRNWNAICLNQKCRLFGQVLGTRARKPKPNRHHCSKCKSDVEWKRPEAL